MGDNSSPRRWSHQASDFNCGRECHNALATILDLMEVEKREAADREKRLVSRIDLLARTVKDLSGSVVTQSTISTPTYAWANSKIKLIIKIRSAFQSDLCKK